MAVTIRENHTRRDALLSQCASLMDAGWQFSVCGEPGDWALTFIDPRIPHPKVKQPPTQAQQDQPA